MAFVPRSSVPFPGGLNDASTTINERTFNLTTLRYWNYTLYSNGTLSNSSDCYLISEPYTPVLYQNGTFRNSTSCFTPINSIGNHGAFGSLFCLSILFSLVDLRKHGRSYLLREKRWKAVGRRWTWYWLLFVAASASISCFTAIDVDRDFLPHLPMVLQSFFFALAVPGLLAAVFETVRNW